jgi:hypothetical protein
MAKKLGSKEVVSFKELLMSEIVQSEALLNVPETKQLLCAVHPLLSQ